MQAARLRKEMEQIQSTVAGIHSREVEVHQQILELADSSGMCPLMHHMHHLV